MVRGERGRRAFKRGDEGEAHEFEGGAACGEDEDGENAGAGVQAFRQAIFEADGLVIAANDARFAPGIDRSSQFVADWSGDRLALGENALAEGIVRYKRR